MTLFLLGFTCALVAVTAQGMVCLVDMAKASRASRSWRRGVPRVLGSSESPLRGFNRGWK